MTDLIRRSDAIEAICMNDCGGCRPNECGAYLDKSCDIVKALSALPSADITETETCQRCQESVDTVLNRQGERIKELEASAEAEQVTGKLKKPCDSLLTGDSDECKEQKSKLEASAEAVQIPIKLEKRYPESKDEDITDAFMRGYLAGRSSAEAVTHGRLIDADALSEKLCETTIFIKDGEVFQRMINDAPTVSAEAVQGWRTGKPIKGGKYIVTLIGIGGYRFVSIMHYDKPFLPNIEVSGACWYRDDDEWGDVVYDDKDILAWMPLPTPYKGGDSE